MLRIISMEELHGESIDPRVCVVLELSTTYPLRKFAAIADVEDFINNRRGMESALYFAFRKKTGGAFKVLNYTEITNRFLQGRITS